MLLTPACIVDLTLPDDVIIECKEDVQCPQDWVCAAALEHDTRAVLKDNEARTLLLATTGDVFDGFAAAAADLSSDAKRAATSADTADHAKAISDFLAAST